MKKSQGFRLLILIFLVIGISINANAQGRTVTGTVKDDISNAPLEGATIEVKDGKNPVLSGAGGSFSITVPDGKITLIISYVGYTTATITINSDETVVTVPLTQSLGNQLSDVVVVGYGTQKRSDLTGSIVTLKSSDLTLGGTTSNAAQAMQGRAAGVAVTQNSKAPGGSISVKIRGNNSISSTNEPLYVVDGFPTRNGVDINPNDIESMDILKDASATAIYGARGANGVVIITTKKGKSGKPQVSYNGYTGMQKIVNPFDMLSGKDYMLLANALYKENAGKENVEYGVYSQSQLESDINTDWIKETTRKGVVSSHNLQFQSGTENTKVLGSIGYFDQSGVLKNTSYSRLSGRVNVDQKISDYIRTGIYMYGQRANSNVQEYSGNILQSNVLGQILTYDPTVPVYNADGSFGRPPGGRGDNPLANLVGRQYDLVQDRFNGTAYLEIKPIKELTGRVNVGTEILRSSSGKYLPRSTYQGGIDNGVANTIDISNSRQLIDATLTYAKTFNEVHSINVLGGYAYEKTITSNRSINVKGFSTDIYNYYNLGAASTITGVGSTKSESILISMFGRLNYAYLDKYLATFTMRRDGSSPFGANNRLGYFPSGALAWRMDKEKFIQDLNLFSSLKLRLGYGKTGNDQIGNYASYALIGPTHVTYDGSSNTSGTHPSPTNPENPFLKWETTTQYNAGLDMGFLDSRLVVTLDAYYKKTTDLLLRTNLPLYSGFSSQQSNVGSLQNKGIELDILSHNVAGNNFTWDTRFNFSLNRNKILDLDGQIFYLTSSKPIGTVSENQYAIIQEGESLGSLFGYVYDGVLQAGETYAPQQNSKAGDPKFKDISGPDGKPDGKIDSYDREIIGSGNPKFNYGLTNSFSYKGFDLNVFLYGAAGNDVLNMSRINLELNKTQEALNRWTTTNTNTDLPRNGFYSSPYGGYINSHFIENASFLRMKNVTLGYTFNSKSTIFRSLRLYGTVENLFTITKYSGWDPEVDTKAYESNTSGNAVGGQSANGGVGMDFNSYPAMRSVTFGLNINF